MAEDEGDLDDDNYTGSDSESSEGGDSEDDEGSNDSKDGLATDSGTEGEGGRERRGSQLEPESEDVEDDQEESLDPKHHPLLRLGAMSKKISKAMLNAVVEIMEEDFGTRVSGAAGSDEEDELDDDEL